MVKRITNAGKTCTTRDCEEDAKCAGLCGACYSWHYVRSNEGVAAGQRYRKKMKRINNRIEDLPAPPPKKTATASRGRSRATEDRVH